jgi:hypothetical protein
MNKDIYTQKVEDFLKESHFTQIQNDPTDKSSNSAKWTVISKVLSKVPLMMAKLRPKHM